MKSRYLYKNQGHIFLKEDDEQRTPVIRFTRATRCHCSDTTYNKQRERTMPNAAIYARYSTDEQRDTSIEDQVRRSKETAKKLGYDVPAHLVFADKATSGTAKARHKRVEYDKLIKAWDNKEFDAVIADEVSRLARDPVALATLQVRIEKTHVRLICSDGLDSSRAGWQLQFGFSSVIAAHFVRETGHRVTRGMIGQLERGFMIAAPPFGYKAVRENDEGTRWIIDEEKAAHVRKIFNMRKEGAALNAIALHMNEYKILAPRAPRKEKVRYWRPATIQQMLNNTIYRGVFVWNGSAFSKAKEKKGEVKLDPVDYPRPELRIVDDDVWFACNQVKKPWKRGGDKHVFAGLVSCYVCDSNLTVSTGGNSHSLYCAQCAQAGFVGMKDRKSEYVSTKGVQAVLIYALNLLFSDEADACFKEQLREKLNGGNEVRISELKQRIAQKEAKIKMLLRMMASSDTADDAVEQEYRTVLAEKRELAAELSKLEMHELSVDKKSIEQQLSADPRQLLPELFANKVSAEKVRAVLRRLFSKITFLGKSEKYTSKFKIELLPGVVLAEASATQVIDHRVEVLMLRLVGGEKRPSEWIVEEIVK